MGSSSTLRFVPEGYGIFRKVRQSTPSLRILARRVCGLISSKAAAPKGPSTQPFVFCNAASICWRMAASSVGKGEHDYSATQKALGLAINEFPIDKTLFSVLLYAQEQRKENYR